MAEFNAYGDENAAKEQEFLARIESLDAQMDGYYAGLGRKYMEIHHDDFEEALSEEAGLILDAEKQKIECRKGILSLKGRTLCENCGSELPEKAVFCGFCGYKMPEADNDIPEGQIRCAYCRAIQPVGLKFCMNCGKPIAGEAKDGDDEEIFEVDETAPAVEEPEVEAPAVEEPVAETPKEPPVSPYFPPVSEPENEDRPLFCTNCGSRLDADALFCSECGFKCV